MLARSEGSAAIMFPENDDKEDPVSRTRRIRAPGTRAAMVQQNKSKPWSSLTLPLALLTFAAILGPSCVAKAQRQAQGQLPEDYLTESSVVLITGAAGFLGSELALALHQTYSPKKIIAIDRMGDHPQSQDELALFEFRRQRAFHVMQTLGGRGEFFRVDFRPMIPDYYDIGEVPVLDHIFRENPDITHVVHLADRHPHSAMQVIPREKEVPKAGMMEALLEQIVKVKIEGRRMPHFVYASSADVYPTNSTVNEPPYSEDKPISTPSSIRGASKLIDEVLAKLYHDMHGTFSVGLRFFFVYGPWSMPGSPLYEMAERVISGAPALSDADNQENGMVISNLRDYVYIDDAVDAMMAAMQFRPQGKTTSPVVVNVASGKGTSLKSIAGIMEELYPTDYGSKKAKRNKTLELKYPSTFVHNPVSFGSTKRANALLGYRPRVPLREGLIQLLAWHYDRAYPYGGRQSVPEDSKRKFIASKGILSCLPHDVECLRGTPVYPCASECAHEEQCTSSYYDNVVGWTHALTAMCEAVLYTVELSSDLVLLPSAQFKAHPPNSEPFFDGPCNLAFVSENSPLVRSLRKPCFLDCSDSTPMMHGRWILVPLAVPTTPTHDEDVLRLLPKLSPGLFFGAKTKRAIYCDPDIVLHNLQRLIRESTLQPYSDEVEGATALLIGKDTKKFGIGGSDDGNMDPAYRKPQFQIMASRAVQNAAYRMVRITVMDELFGDGFMEWLDSRWLVHTLQSDDSRLFRCDVLGEVVQWRVDTDRTALEFILGLHDMWSRFHAKQHNIDPWWIGDGVKTVTSNYSRQRRRRLQEELDKSGEGGVNAGEDKTSEGDEDGVGGNDGEEGGEDNNDANGEDNEGVAEDVFEAARTVDAEDKGGENDEDEDENENQGNKDEGADAPQANEKKDLGRDQVGDVLGASSEDDEEEEEEDPDEASPPDNKPFLKEEEPEPEVNTVNDGQRGASSDQDDDGVAPESENTEDVEVPAVVERDLSSYDTWMGVVSATDVRYFVRIVPSSEIGVFAAADNVSKARV